jgi:hypothetical protein
MIFSSAFFVSSNEFFYFVNILTIELMFFFTSTFWPILIFWLFLDDFEEELLEILDLFESSSESLAIDFLSISYIY